MFLVLVIFVVAVFFYWYGTHTFNYWKLRGVKHDDPIPFFGTNYKQFLQKASVGMLANEMYRKYPDEKVVGCFRGVMPELVIRDPEIAKRILVTDFQSFYARAKHPDPTNIEPLLQNLFFANGDTWRLLRQRFTSAFTSGKLKAMFPLITARAEKLQMMTEKVSEQDVFDARELFGRYTTDFIGDCGFGIDMDTLSDDNSQFRKLGRRIFQRNLRDVVCSFLKFLFPKVFKHLTILAPEIQTNLSGLFQAVVKERGYKPSGRNDFIDLLLELRQEGNLIGESLEKTNPDGSPVTVELDLDDLILTAQLLVFFAAGFETSATASSHTLHQLAFNPECQIKVQQEIDKVLARHGGKLTYDAVKEMTYLEAAFCEGMRMYPSVGYLVRICTVPEYTFPELNLTITTGTGVIIPIAAIHNDDKYFTDPHIFNPDRFAEGVKEDSKKFIYLPFGKGPRACVAGRLGQMLSMIGLASVLHKFSVEPAACSVRVPVPDPVGTVSEGFQHGLPLKFKKRAEFL